MLNELNRRFSDPNRDLMAIQSCNPESSSFLDPEKLLPFIDTYNLDKELLSGKNISSVHYEVFVEVSPLKNDLKKMNS